MRRILNQCLLLSLLAVFSCAAVSLSFEYLINNPGWLPDPYIGAEAQMLKMPLNSSYGGNVVKKTYPQGNLFLGFNFCDYLALEGGYEVTPTQVSRVFIPSRNLLFGRLTNGTTIQYARSQIKGWHADLLGFLTLSECYQLQLLGAIGIGRPQLFILSYQDGPNSLGGIPNVFIPNNFRHYKQTKSVLRLSVGLQHMLTYCCGARLTFGWVNTNRFGSMNSIFTSSANLINVAQPRNSIRLGVGIFSYF